LCVVETGEALQLTVTAEAIRTFYLYKMRPWVGVPGLRKSLDATDRSIAPIEFKVAFTDMFEPI
jgi:hypothetical protein